MGTTAQELQPGVNNGEIFYCFISRRKLIITSIFLMLLGYHPCVVYMIYACRLPEAMIDIHSLVFIKTVKILYKVLTDDLMWCSALGLSDGQSSAETNNQTSRFPFLKQYKWWIQMAIYSFFVLAGQNLGVLLGRVYFDKGGNSKWMGTLVQVTGFPILFPFQWLTKTDKNSVEISTRKPSSPLILASVYLCLGIFLAADCMLYTIGLQYLPVTTYTLICASQLGFNALFSFFLNGQKFTPYILNSIVILTISSVLLVFQSDPGDSNKTSKKKYVIGFLCTLGASAGYGLMLPLTQLAFQKIIKKETISAVIDMSIYQCMVATFVVVIGLFASGEWSTLDREMNRFESGKVSYVMNLFWTAVAWQMFIVGCVGLIFKVSSLFSNVISILGLPVAPILAVIFLQDKLTGLKAMSMILAIWGFVSYMYHHYIEEMKMKKEKETNNDIEEVSLTQRVG
ncbi:putative purine permease 6-like [Dorcoceras hygrometricum]|uniref:Probable purine permease n=1 Tax=Dorcoceras hygrometricum TaxID=472368 RepID=A0A2Z7D1N2_9LAMI|nr:putative purine permease 6-like [Dorcoceras hygrometricum]